jgi:hypothetical protein
MYHAHPSRELTQRFVAKPYQGAAPELATFLFVGLDANYDADIECSLIFGDLLAYHEDGVAFWRRTGVHHPFLLPAYIGDGRFYHQSFARIGFMPKHASLVSFLELLHVPTVGRNKLEATDLDPSHLLRVDAAIIAGQAKHIFLPAGVVRLMRETGAFPWLPERRTPRAVILPALYAANGHTVYSHLHFSNYGKFQQQKVAEAEAIAQLIPSGG